MTPGEHGVIGYRMDVDGEILNVLRWWASGRDARDSIPPEKIQPSEPFLGHRPAVVTRAEFRHSGFTQAHLEGVRFSGYRMPSTLVAETARLVTAPTSRSCTRTTTASTRSPTSTAWPITTTPSSSRSTGMVEYLIRLLPTTAALVLTSDHGQVDVGDNMVALHADVAAHVSYQSGEGRFRWLHARPGHARVLLEAARSVTATPDGS